MKKRLAAVFLSAVMAASSISAVYAEVGEVRVDGAAVDFGDTEPIIVDNYMYVPIRAVFEKLGTVDWNDETKTVIITNEKNTLELDTATGEIRLNGAVTQADGSAPVVPIVENGRTYLPIRSIAETFGADVQWNSADSSLDIYSEGYDSSQAAVKLSQKGEQFKAEIEDMDFIESVYMVFFGDVDVSVYEGLEIACSTSDTSGYEDLVKSIESMRQYIAVHGEKAYINDGSYSNEQFYNIFMEWVENYGKFSSLFLNELDKLKDKSFMSEYVRGVIEYKSDDVIIDNTLNTKDSWLAFINAIYDDDAESITVNRETALFCSMISCDFDEIAENCDDAEQTKKDMDILDVLLSGYVSYTLDYDSKYQAAVEKYKRQNAEIHLAAAEEFKNNIQGKSMIEALYIGFFRTTDLSISEYMQIVLDNTDTKGYDNLVKSMQNYIKYDNSVSDRIYSDYDTNSYNYELVSIGAELYYTYEYEFMMALDNAENKDFMTYLVRRVFENEDIDIDNSLSTEESLAALSGFSERTDDSANLVLNQKIGLLVKLAIPDFTGSMDANSADFDVMFSDLTKFKELGTGYSYYLYSYDSEMQDLKNKGSLDVLKELA